MPANLGKISVLQASRDKKMTKLSKNHENQGANTFNPILLHALKSNISHLSPQFHCKIIIF